MKAAYLKAPYQFEVRDVELREIKDTEVIVDVKACGFCGHDNILASYQAKEWEPFGHEFSGVVEKVGKDVTDFKAGDRLYRNRHLRPAARLLEKRPPRF